MPLMPVNPHSSTNLYKYIISLIKSFLAICGLILLLICYHLLIFRLEGGDFHDPVKTILTLLAFMQKQKELEYLFWAAGFSFIALNFMPKRIKGPLYAISVIVITSWVLYRVFNLVHVYYAGTHVGKDFISHMEKSSFSMLWDIKALLLFIAIPVPMVFLLCFLLKKLDHSSSGLKLKLIVFTILSLIFYSSTHLLKNELKSLTLNLWMSEFNYRNPAAVKIPEKFLFSSLEKKPFETTYGSIRETLPAVTKEKLKKFFGISIDEKASLPLFKKNVFSDKFPYTTVDNRTSTPNIIIFAMESLSSKLLGSYGAPFHEISPNIDKFANESLVVRPFYNSSTPTINGLVALLCSHHPVSGHKEWVDSKGSMNFDLLCLPEVLKERGYQSYNAVPGDPYFALQLPFMKANGMDGIYGALELKEVLKENPLGRVFEGSTYSDHQIIHFLINMLRTRHFAEPFTITVSTNDLHPPFRLPGDCIEYAGDRSSILRLVHNADAAFGDFWKYYKNSVFSSNTIIILTADHALFPGIEYKKLLSNQGIGFYDEIPFIIYDPTHELPKTLNVTSSSIDIVPSLLHLLDINVRNSFEGLSVFDRNGRIKFRGLLGSHQYLFFYRINGNNVYLNRDDIKCSDIPSDAAAAEEAFTACDYSYWWQYERRLEQNDLIWKKE
jgi:phosphoglycerol transferase MdoB-like AlkP superfamily enzyme